MLKRGDRIGDWVVDETLGEGGMGAVYRVHSALTPRLAAALKVLKPTADAEARARFVREAEALSALRHPAIVHVMGFSEDEKRGLLYIVMELAFGETLKARMDRGPMTLEDATRVFTRLASALEHAHAAGVYHRDLKPANVILCHDGSVRLVDFGIAATQTAEPLTAGGHIGTISYVPPEVFRGEKGDPRAADVYAFGLVLHEALVGRRMFPVESGLTPAAAAAAVGVRKLEQKPFDPGKNVPDRVRAIIRGATDPTPGARPHMTEIRKTLVSLRERRGQVDASERTPIPGSVPRPMMAPPVKHEDRTMRVPDPARPAEDEGVLVDRVRHRRPARRLTPLYAGAGALLLVGGLAVGLSQSNDEPREPAPADGTVQAAPPSAPEGPRLVMPTPPPKGGVYTVPQGVVTPAPAVATPGPQAPGATNATPPAVFIPARDPQPPQSQPPRPQASTPAPPPTQPAQQRPPQTQAPATSPPRPTSAPVVVHPEIVPEEEVPEAEYQPPPGTEDEAEPEPEPTPPAPRS